MHRRALLEQTGWDASLRIDAHDTLPEPGPDEVLVEVGACGVAYRDVIDRSGRIPFIATPIVPGHEAAGRVLAVGRDVTRWAPGDAVATLHRDHCGTCPRCLEGETSLCQFAARVFGLTVDGGYQSHMIAAETALFAVPDDMPVAHAAILNSTFGTAYRAMNRFGGLSEGQRVVVTGANGGVGSAAIQIANRQGAQVTAVVRRNEHVEFVEELGAHEVIVDDACAFHKQMGYRADVVLDCVGQPTFNASLRATRMGGGLAVVGNVVEERAEVNLGFVVVNDIRIVGSTGATPRDLAALLELHARAPLAFHIEQRLPLEQADAAQRAVRAGNRRGRIVLEMQAAPTS